MMTTFENKTVLYYVQKSTRKNPIPIETSQSICFSNKMTGYYTTQVFNECYLQTNCNGKCQRFKNEKRKLLVQSYLYSEPRQYCQIAHFPKVVNCLNSLTNFGRTPSWISGCALNMLPLKLCLKPILAI